MDWPAWISSIELLKAWGCRSLQSAADLRRELVKTDRELDRLAAKRIMLTWDIKQREAGRNYGHKPLTAFEGA